MANSIEELNDLLKQHTPPTYPGAPMRPQTEWGDTPSASFNPTYTESKEVSPGKVHSQDIVVNAGVPGSSVPPSSSSPFELPTQTAQPQDLNTSLSEIRKSMHSTEPYKIAEEYVKANKPRELGWGDVLQMAIPTAIGAAYGRIDKGAAIGADYGNRVIDRFNKQQDSMDEALRKIALQRASDMYKTERKSMGKSGDSGKFLIDVNGKPVYASREQAMGQIAFMQGSPDWKQFKYKDPVYGKDRWGWENGRTKERVMGLDDPEITGTEKSNAEQGKSDRQLQAQRFQAVGKFTDRNHPITTSLSNMEGIVKAQGLLNDGGVVGASILPGIIARNVGEEKSVLTDQDVLRVQGDPSALARLNRGWNKLINGESLQEYDRNDVSTLLKVAYNVEHDRLKKLRNAYTSAYGAAGVDMGSAIDKYIALRTPTLPALKNPVASSRMKERLVPTYKKGDLVKVQRVGSDGKLLYNPDGSPQYDTYRAKEDINRGN